MSWDANCAVDDEMKKRELYGKGCAVIIHSHIGRATAIRTGENTAKTARPSLHVEPEPRLMEQSDSLRRLLLHSILERYKP